MQFPHLPRFQHVLNPFILFWVRDHGYLVWIIKQVVGNRPIDFNLVWFVSVPKESKASALGNSWSLAIDSTIPAKCPASETPQPKVHQPATSESRPVPSEAPMSTSGSVQKRRPVFLKVVLNFVLKRLKMVKWQSPSSILPACRKVSSSRRVPRVPSLSQQLWNQNNQNIPKEFLLFTVIPTVMAHLGNSNETTFVNSDPKQ